MMINLKNITLFITVIGIAFYLPATKGAPTSISDDRIRSLNVVPVLGRGYSLGTNSFQSTCLMVDEVSTPSYNYDYDFTDFSKSTDMEATMSGKIAASFGYWKVKDEIMIAARSGSEPLMIVGTMRIERYYSSIREELSLISESALTLLDRQDYIGFFKSCGPTYVRSIRRAQELTSIFKFDSQSSEVAAEFALALHLQSPVRSDSANILSKPKYASIASSLEITIYAFGMGLNQEGSSVIVSTTLDHYQDVLKFAYKSFTQNEDSSNIGMVYGIEVVPWVDNTGFQVESKLLEEEILIPLPRSMIPKAIQINGLNDLTFANTIVERAQFHCKNAPYQMDRYGYCCESTLLWNPLARDYETESSNVTSTRICRPARKLDKSTVKNNMSVNAEFVAHLDSIIRNKLNQLYTLQKCLSSLMTYSSDYDYHTMKVQDTAKYDAAIEDTITLREVKGALDPLGDFSLIRLMGQELDEYVEMYYEPCVAALFGLNIGTTNDVEAQYFMAYGWLTHAACSKLSCLADNMRWDRNEENNAGCVASAIVGSRAPSYMGRQGNCAKKLDNTCKYNQMQNIQFELSAKECWTCEGDCEGGDEELVPLFFLNQFCMPVTNTHEVEDTSDIRTRTNSCRRNPSNRVGTDWDSSYVDSSKP